VTGLPLETRQELLADALSKVQYPVIQSTAFDVTPAKLIKAAKELDLEGVIAKRDRHRSVRRADRRLLRGPRAAVRLKGQSWVQPAVTTRAVPAFSDS
jgi:ATP-dependent DNA ligase